MEGTIHPQYRVESVPDYTQAGVCLGNNTRAYERKRGDIVTSVIDGDSKVLYYLDPYMRIPGPHYLWMGLHDKRNGWCPVRKAVWGKSYIAEDYPGHV